MTSIIPPRYKSSGGAKLTLHDVEELEKKYKELDIPIPKYLAFCRYALEHGYKLHLYNAQRTVSKYVTVHDGRKRFKIRWSNHKPNFEREVSGDCDFFVGITNLGVTTTRDAWFAMLKYFEED